MSESKTQFVERAGKDGRGIPLEDLGAGGGGQGDLMEEGRKGEREEEEEGVREEEEEEGEGMREGEE